MVPHLLAASYLAIVSAVVVIIEAQLGFRLSSFWGLQFRTSVIYPLPFWLMTLAYVYLASRRTRPAPRAWLGRAILLGAWVHLSLLAITMSHETDLLALLTAGFFAYYVTVVVGTIVIGSCVLSAAYCAAWWQGWRDDFWLPVAYLPIVHILLQRSRGSLVAVIEVGLVVAAVLAADRRVLTTLVDTAKRWRPRLVNDATIIAAIYLLAFLIRFTAARRLSGMGIHVVMTNTDDPDQYHRAAVTLLHGEWIARYTSVGYDLFLAGLYWLTNVNIGRTLVLQAAFASTVPVAVYLLGHRLFNRAAGVTSAVLAALSQLLIFNSVNLTREVAGSLFVPWAVLLLVLSLPRGRESDRGWLTVPAGVVFGFLIAYDPTFLIVTIVLAVGFMACTRFTLWQRATRIAVFLIVTGVCAIGIIRFATGDKTILARDDQNLATSVSMDFNPYASLLFQRGINAFAYRNESIHNVLTDPANNLTLVAQKLWLDGRRFLFEGNAGRFDPVILVQGSVLAANLDFYGYLFGFLGAAAGLVGIFGRPARLDRAALYVVLLCYSAVYVTLFFGMTRFRVPVQPLLLVLVGAGISTVFRFALSGAFSRDSAGALHA